MLTKERLKGIWVAVPTEWDQEGNFDEKTFRDEVAMLIGAGVHGVYTTGTTGEFYALDWHEYTQLVDAFAAETVGKCPMQVGANSFNTRETIKQVRYARDKGIEAAQVCFPGWVEMRTEDYDQFLVDVYEAVPDIALVHYNTVRTKRLFTGQDYARVLATGRVPTLIGSKAIMSLSDHLFLQIFASQMNHFVDAYFLPLAMQMGAKGTYTTFSLMNPKLLQDFYADCEAGRWEQAIAFSKRLARWVCLALVPLLDKGYRDAPIDKAMNELGGWLPGNRRTRKPYSPLADEDFAQLRAVTEKEFPELLGYRP